MGKPLQPGSWGETLYPQCDQGMRGCGGGNCDSLVCRPSWGLAGRMIRRMIAWRLLDVFSKEHLSSQQSPPPLALPPVPLLFSVSALSSALSPP